MTLTVTLPPDVEQALRDRALTCGRDAAELARDFIERGVREPQPTVAAPATAMDKWMHKLSLFERLQPGWNGHNAPVPDAVAIRNTGAFLGVSAAAGPEPTRLTASAVGGAAVTFRRGDRKVMVEFLNQGRVHALFADDAAQTLDTKSVESNEAAYQAFLETVRSYLDG